MRECKRTDYQLVWIDVNLVRIAEIFRQPVVIAQHDIHFNVGILPAPCTKLIPLVVYIAVKEIAHKKHVRRICVCDDLIQSGEVILCAFLRNRYSGLSEVCDFSDVKIAQQKHALFFPENCLLWQQ